MHFIALKIESNCIKKAIDYLWKCNIPIFQVTVGDTGVEGLGKIVDFGPGR